MGLMMGWPLKVVVVVLFSCLLTPLYANEDAAPGSEELWQRGVQLLQQGDTKEASVLFEQGLRIDEQRYGKEHPVLLKWLDRQRIAFSILSEEQESAAAFDRIHRLKEAALQSGDPARLELLGQICLALGSHCAPLAVDVFTKLVELREKTAAEDPQSLINALILLAQADQKLSALDKAAAGLERALALLVQQSGDEHALVAILKPLSEVQLFRLKYDQAELLFKRIIAIEEKFHPAVHGSVILSHYQLAWFYDQQDRYEEGIAILSPVIRQLEQHDPDHAELFQLLQLRSQMLIKDKQIAKAAAAVHRLSTMVVKPDASEDQRIQALRYWLYRGYLTERKLVRPMLSERFIGEIYTLESRSRDQRPALTFLLRQRLLQQHIEYDVRMVMTFRYLEMLLDVYDRHWPASDTELLELVNSLMSVTEEKYPEGAGQRYTALAERYKRSRGHIAQHFHSKARRLGSGI